MKDTIIEGKVKTVFTTSEPDEVLIQYEDKVTAGNGRKVDYPEGKGQVCCKISEFLFEKLEKKGIRTHYISTIPLRIMCCKRVEIIPIEVVVRNVAAGSIVRQTTLEEGQIINWPLVEYFLKDDEKDDPLLTEDRINLMGYGDVLKDLEYTAREINAILKETFSNIGLTLVDFKLEFGYDADHNLLLADELSPDGMRLWKEGTTESYDKDLFRKDEGDIVNTYQYILSKLQEVDSCTEI
jgi:phosphoribosylaminoimidazole-succinocarboxamide synthase